MTEDMPSTASSSPLSGVRVVERSSTVAAAYTGRMLATFGAEVIMVEPEGGSALRLEPPFLPGAPQIGALFAYLSAGKKSVTLDAGTEAGRQSWDNLLATADILIEDSPVAEKGSCGVDPERIAARFPDLVHVSVLPFGSFGSKGDWRAEEINLIHASGEGFLLPNGLSVEQFPERAPLKIHGHFASMQGGAVAALAALTALWAKEAVGGQYVDVSVQDAAVATGAFAIQRLGDGSLEHRKERSFKYGGVIPCADGYVELLTLEDRQWQGLVKLLGEPAWATESSLSNGIERSRRGAEINAHLRKWALGYSTEDIARQAQLLGIPVAKYRSPEEVLAGEHEQARGLFAPVSAGSRMLDILVSPYHFEGKPLVLPHGIPVLPDEMTPDLVEEGHAGHPKKRWSGGPA